MSPMSNCQASDRAQHPAYFLSSTIAILTLLMLFGLPRKSSGEVVFGAPNLPADWFTIPWSPGGAANIVAGNLITDGARVGTNALYSPPCSLQFTATFSGDAWQHIGFGTDYNAGPWVIFSTFQGGQLYARTNTGSGGVIDTPLSAVYLGAPHLYRIDWTEGSVVFSIDGSVVATHALAVTASLRPLISDLNAGGGKLLMSSITMTTPVLAADLSGSELPAGWSSSIWGAGGSATVADGLLTVDGARVGTDALFSAGKTLEFVGTFSGDPWQHIGFGMDYTAAPWVIFSTYNDGDLYARTNTLSGQAIDIPITGAWSGSPHSFRIDWTPTNATFWIDQVIVAGSAATIGTNLRPLISDLSVGAGNVTITSLRLSNPVFAINFAASSLPPGWFSGAYASTGTAIVGDSGLTLDGAQAGSNQVYGPGESVEFAATLSGDPSQHLGFGVDYNSGPWMIFSTNQGGQLYARTRDDAGNAIDELIPGQWFGVPHTYRIDWTNNDVVFSIDGSVVATQQVAIATPLRPLASDFSSGGGVVNVTSANLIP